MKKILVFILYPAIFFGQEPSIITTLEYGNRPLKINALEIEFKYRDESPSPDSISTIFTLNQSQSVNYFSIGFFKDDFKEKYEKFIADKSKSFQSEITNINSQIKVLESRIKEEKKDLIEKLSTFENENKSLLKQVSDLKNKNLSASPNEELNDKIIAIEDENNKLRKEIAIMEEELEVSRYKVLEGEKKQKKVSEKLDELNQETENLFEKDEW